MKNQGRAGVLLGDSLVQINWKGKGNGFGRNEIVNAPDGNRTWKPNLVEALDEIMW